MLANVVALVPRIMIENRFSGPTLSLLIGSTLSLVFLYLYTNKILKFPGQGQPEIVLKYLPNWFGKPYLFFVGLLYLIAGWLILVTFIDITKRFINPEMSTIIIGTIFLLIVCAGALMKTERTLFALEITLVISVPLIAGIFLKSLFNEFLSWDAMKVILTHSFETPSIENISAASYSLVGFYYISIYNRVLINKKKKLSLFFMFLIGVVGILNIFTSFLIPIGYNGADGVSEYIYPWFSTADSIRLEFGFIERVLFIFLLLYISVSMISATISSHTGFETLKSILPEIKWKGKYITPTIIAIAFSIITLTGYHMLTQEQIYQFAKYYFILLLPTGVLSVAVLMWAARRKEKR
jgi:hypothetical protein